MINEQLLVPAAWLAHVRQIETLGYNTFLIRDHLVPNYFGDQYAPLSALMAAACATSLLRVGTMVLCNDFRHPAILAKEAATIDALSGGRLELGLGAGWLRDEYMQAGLAYNAPGERIERLEEALQIITRLWSGQPLHFAGKHYQVAGLSQTPSPLQSPRPPLFLGGGHKRMLGLAGRLADSVGLLTTSVASGALVEDPAERLPASVETKLGWVRAGAGERFMQIELSLLPTMILTDNLEAAATELIAKRGWNGIDVAQVLSMPSVFVGNLEQIGSTMLERRARYGFSYYIFSDTHAAAFAPLVERLRGQ